MSEVTHADIVLMALILALAVMLSDASIAPLETYEAAAQILAEVGL